MKYQIIGWSVIALAFLGCIKLGEMFWDAWAWVLDRLKRTNNGNSK